MSYAEIDFLASERHFIDHLAPIWHALPDFLRGRFLVPSDLVGHAMGHRIVPDLRPRGRWAPERPIVVASHGDLRRLHHGPAVFCEHGAGQSYSDSCANYVGGTGREAVELFLMPNEQAAARNRETWDHAPTEVVGCPKLDRYATWCGDPLCPCQDGDSCHYADEPHLEGSAAVGWRFRGGATSPTVAVSFHWDPPDNIAPEARSAWSRYPNLCGLLVDAGYRVLAHGHPRSFPQRAPAMARQGAEIVPDFADVLARADLYLCDNSSTLYEFMATGRPVVGLNAPWYRRHVEHGLRFWRLAPPIQVEHEAEVLGAVGSALSPLVAGLAMRDLQEWIVGEVYPHLGEAASRAAQAIIDRFQLPGRTPITRIAGARVR